MKPRKPISAKVTSTFSPTPEQIKEWKEKHIHIYQLDTADGRSCIVFDPTFNSNLAIMKLILKAFTLGDYEYAEAVINQCWVGGDDSIKKDPRAIEGFIPKVKDIIELPDYEVIQDDEQETATIIYEGQSFRVKQADRLDTKYAEDRNKGDKPLDTQMYLLERLAIDDLTPWRNTRGYLALLLAMGDIKKSVQVAVKKL
ncbi:hypothetical protein ACFQ21_00115 [Ohtaekwangia kribbensis]|uniref:Uncharacterized protein n=1 Tax=Ohtaekwangia kribbensis TaxID=688913 RepID=A0ABW3JXN9_9BACT